MLSTVKYNLLRFIIRFLFFILALLWFAGLVSPCSKNTLLHSIYPYLKLGYSTVCHQTEAKSFTCGNSTFLVCARCTGIYFAVLITSFVTLFIKTRIKIKTNYLVLFSIPMLADVIFYSIGIYKYNKVVAGLSGFLFGSAVFLYILGAIENSLCTKTKS